MVEDNLHMALSICLAYLWLECNFIVNNFHPHAHNRLPISPNAARFLFLTFIYSSIICLVSLLLFIIELFGSHQFDIDQPTAVPQSFHNSQNNSFVASIE